MDEQHKKDIAVFRFGVISDFVNRIHMERGERQRLLDEKCDRSWQIPFSDRTRLAPSTIEHWIRSYKESGNRLEALYPEDRADRGKPRAINEETAQALIRLRKELPTWGVKPLVQEMVRRGLVDPGVKLKLPTVYRFLHEQGLMDLAGPVPVDRRRFESELPNDCWQSDVMHGPTVPVNDKQRKTYLIAFLDDMSRLVPHAEFYLSERLDVYLDAFRKALLKRGLPRKLYLDNGPAFRARHLKEITASLGIALVHSPPYTPQGRGKVERFFRTVRSQFLSSFAGNSLAELNNALDRWIREVYHPRNHGSTGQSPLKRFTDHMECIRPAPKDLEDHFRKQVRRRVAKDRTVCLNGKFYEAPVALIGRHVTLIYHEHDPARVEILLDGASYGFIAPVDLRVNCRVKRKQQIITLENNGGGNIAGGKLFGADRNPRED